MSSKTDKLQKNMELKQALDELVSDDKIIVNDGEEISKIRQEGQVQLYTDFNKLSTTAKEESKAIVESIMKFYLDLDIIDKNEFVQYKKKLHIMNISAVMFQMQTAEYVCIKLLEEIDSGNANLKTFEVFSKLQETMMKIVDMQTVGIAKMEDQWKKIRADSEEVKLYNHEDTADDDSSMLRIKGSRKMVEIAQRISAEQGINNMPSHEIKTDPTEAYRESMKTEDESPENKIDDELF